MLTFADILEFNGTSTVNQIKEYCHFVFLSDINTIADIIMSCIQDEKEPFDIGKRKKKPSKKLDADGAKTEASSLYSVTDTTFDSKYHLLANNSRIAKKLLHPVWVELLCGYSEVCSVLWCIQAEMSI